MNHPDQTSTVDSKKIGIIGGLAFRAGIYYYEQILNRCNEQGSKLQLILSHASVDAVLPLVNAGDKVEIGKYLGGLSNELFAAGATSVSVTAIAPHLAIDEIKQTATGHIVNALDTIKPAIESRRLDKVAVFGNKAVMATDIYGAVPGDLVASLGQNEQTSVHEMYMDIALNGKRGTAAEVGFLNTLANELIEKQGVQAIVLAGTDLSSFYAAEPPAFPFIDMAQLHIDQILSQ